MERNETLRNDSSRKDSSASEAVLLSPEAAAGLLSLTRSQVYKLMRAGDLRAVKIGGRGQWRISRRALDEFVAGLEAAAEARVSALRARH